MTTTTTTTSQTTSRRNFQSSIRGRLSSDEIVDAVRDVRDARVFRAGGIIQSHRTRYVDADAQRAFYALSKATKLKGTERKQPRVHAVRRGDAGCQSKGRFEGRILYRSRVRRDEAHLPLRGKNVWLTDEDIEENDMDAKGVGRQFREGMEKYYEEMVTFCKGFMPTFAEALGLEKTFFDDKFKPHNALLRPLKYGKVKSEGDQFGCGAHSDYGVITVLWVQPGSKA